MSRVWLHAGALASGRRPRAFEERSFRLLDGEVEVDETYFGASFDNRRARERAKLRKVGKAREAGAETAYNLKKPVRPSHHPLRAFTRETRNLIGLRWRPGSAWTADGVED